VALVVGGEEKGLSVLTRKTLRDRCVDTQLARQFVERRCRRVGGSF